jgi:hypothetical protein
MVNFHAMVPTSPLSWPTHRNEQGSPRAEDSGGIHIVAAIVTALLAPDRDFAARGNQQPIIDMGSIILGWDGPPDAQARHSFPRDDGRRLYLLDHRLRGFLGDKPASVSRLGSASYASERSAVDKTTTLSIGLRMAIWREFRHWPKTRLALNRTWSTPLTQPQRS